MPAAETKNRPARAELAVGDRDILAAAEERAGVVLAFHAAICHVHVRGADEMEPVVVAVHAAVDVDAGKPRIAALDDTDGMIRAVLHYNVPNAQIFALIEQ